MIDILKTNLTADQKIGNKINALKYEHKEYALKSVDGIKIMDFVQCFPAACLLIMIAFILPFSFVTIPVIILAWIIKSPEVRRVHYQKKAEKLKKQIESLGSSLLN